MRRAVLALAGSVALFGGLAQAHARHRRHHHKPPASGSVGNHFTLSGNIAATINDAGKEGCIGLSISGAGYLGKTAEIDTSGVAQPGTFTLPDTSVVRVLAVLYPAATADDPQASKYYSWTDPSGTITLTETAHGGVKGSLDLTLEPGYYSRSDGTYTNEATSAETVKGSWNCPLS
jgi:hypothetical protein